MKLRRILSRIDLMKNADDFAHYKILKNYKNIIKYIENIIFVIIKMNTVKQVSKCEEVVHNVNEMLNGHL